VLRFFNTALSTVLHFHHHTCSSGSSEVRIILNGLRIASVTVSGPLTNCTLLLCVKLLTNCQSMQLLSRKKMFTHVVKISLVIWNCYNAIGHRVRISYFKPIYRLKVYFWNKCFLLSLHILLFFWYVVLAATNGGRLHVYVANIVGESDYVDKIIWESDYIGNTIGRVRLRWQHYGRIRLFGQHYGRVRLFEQHYGRFGLFWQHYGRFGLFWQHYGRVRLRWQLYGRVGLHW